MVYNLFIDLKVFICDRKVLLYNYFFAEIDSKGTNHFLTNCFNLLAVFFPYLVLISFKSYIQTHLLFVHGF